jgi:hypothetical protein
MGIRREGGGEVATARGAGALRHSNNSSYAGLTRVSIDLQKSLAKKMDGRVKPGHDELLQYVKA